MFPVSSLGQGTGSNLELVPNRPLPTTVSGGEYQFHHDVHCMICDINILLLLVLIEVTMNESILLCVNCCISSNVNCPEVYCVIKHIYKTF